MKNAVISMIFLCVAAFFAFNQALGAENASARPESGLHGGAWAFGQSKGRKDALWHEGVNAGEIEKRAHAGKNKEAVDTTEGINRALNEAKKKESGGSMGFNMSREGSAFKVTPDAMRSDEYMPRDSQNVARAYADMKGEDIDVRIGPELIMKDKSKGAEGHEDQPDASLGVGMRFKMDF